MLCKRCGASLDGKSNFCPYCGTQVENVKVDNTKTGYDDPFKDIRINTHQDQYNYQTNYSQTNKVTTNELELKPKKNYNNLIALILGISAIFLSFKIGFNSILIALLAFIIALIGKKENRRAPKILTIVFTVFAIITTIIIGTIVTLSKLTIAFSNGYETDIKNYLTNAFYCGFNQNQIEGDWINSYGELMVLGDGNYYIYQDLNDLTNNYYYGYYDIEAGKELEDGMIIYGDDDYYYYYIDTYGNKTKYNQEIYDKTLELLENGFTIKLDKNNKNKIIINSENLETEIEFERR